MHANHVYLRLYTEKGDFENPAKNFVKFTNQQNLPQEMIFF